MDEQTEELVKGVVISISATSMLAVGYIAGLMKEPALVLGLVCGLFAIDFSRGIRRWRERRNNPTFTMIVHMTE